MHPSEARDSIDAHGSVRLNLSRSSGPCAYSMVYLLRPHSGLLNGNLDPSGPSSGGGFLSIPYGLSHSRVRGEWMLEQVSFRLANSLQYVSKYMNT